MLNCDIIVSLESPLCSGYYAGCDIIVSLEAPLCSGYYAELWHYCEFGVTIV